MGAAESLTAWGIVRAREVVEIAASVGLDLASAATLLEIETAGGHNVWGHDGVTTGGAYVKGAEVTRAAYEQYRALRKAGRIGAQGVGPTQLTWPGYQEQADQMGGCWDWRTNCRVGFTVLLGHLRAHGLRTGFRKYNGSGPMAERYADKAMQRRSRWLVRLGDTAGTAPATPTSPTTPTEDDDVSWTKAQGAPAVPDLYKDGLPPLPDPLAALAWSTAHAAHARDRAQEALTEARQTRAMLAAAIGEIAALARSVADLKTDLKTADRTTAVTDTAVDPDALIDVIAERLRRTP
jgi:hypothetical protein